MTRFVLLLTSILLASFSAQAQWADEDRTPAPKGAEAYIISPSDGAKIKGPVTIIFGLKGMGVAPAGTEKAKTGHHHLIIDAPLPPFDENIPADEHHVHFGGGQTQVTIDLAPGTHTLQLLLGDLNHVPHLPAIASKKITVTVTE